MNISVTIQGVDFYAKKKARISYSVDSTAGYHYAYVTPEEGLAYAEHIGDSVTMEVVFPK